MDIQKVMQFRMSYDVMIVNIIRAGGCVVLCLGIGVCMLIVCG